jgi:hypothetical protein
MTPRSMSQPTERFNPYRKPKRLLFGTSGERIQNARHVAAHRIMELKFKPDQSAALWGWCKLLAMCDEALDWPHRKSASELYAEFGPERRA